jgi:hypothetical protein
MTVSVSVYHSISTDLDIMTVSVSVYHSISTDLDIRTVSVSVYHSISTDLDIMTVVVNPVQNNQANNCKCSRLFVPAVTYKIRGL